MLGQSTITLAADDLDTDLLNGALLYVARPGYNGTRNFWATVVDTTANTIVIEDAGGLIADTLYSGGEKLSDFAVLNFNRSAVTNSPAWDTQGTWTSAPSYASGQTTFTNTGAAFASWQVGSILVPDTNIGAPLVVVSATATTLVVAGDARGVAGSGSQYIVYAAPFTDPNHGTLQTDPHNGGTRYLWAGYRYQPPQMGFWVDPPGAPGLGVYGAATGANKLGQYYCWNRTYDIATGRWTTPDPVATPWWNLVAYVGDAPTQGSDPSGCAAAAVAAGAGLTVAQVIALIGAAALAACLVWGNCAEVIAEALRRVGKALERDPPPAPADCGRGGGAGTPPMEGGGTAGHPPGVLAALAASAAAALIAKIGIEAAKKACKAVYDAYSQYKQCKSCDGVTSLGEAITNYWCHMGNLLGRYRWLEMGCDYIMDGSIARDMKYGKGTSEQGHLQAYANAVKAAAKCAQKIAVLSR